MTLRAFNLFFLSTSFTICAASSTALAQSTTQGTTAAALSEVVLNSENLILPAAEVRLIRNAQTPSVLKLSVPIQMSKTVCTQYVQVPHSGANGLQCGYDPFTRTVYYDRPGVCRVVDPVTGRKVCGPPTREYRLETYQRARICTWFESECAQTQVAQSTELRKLKIKFKNSNLADDETETYDLRGAQNGLDDSGITYSLAPVSTKNPVTIKSRYGLFTWFKHVLVVKNAN